MNDDFFKFMTVFKNIDIKTNRRTLLKYPTPDKLYFFPDCFMVQLLKSF